MNLYAYRRSGITLRQIEVLRALLATGTVAGAAKLLNVSAPGISRSMKHAEHLLHLRLFDRVAGRYVPTPEASEIFEQINTVYNRVEDLHNILARIERGDGAEFRLGSVPSISHVMVPRAIRRILAQHPELRFDVNVLKIEEAIDYLLLGRGELVAMSYRLPHAALDFIPLARGELVCVVAQNHELASRDVVSVRDIVRYPMIGIDPNDPYGRIMAGIIEKAGLGYDMRIKARFGITVAALVREGLGVAILDQFTMAEGGLPGLKALRIAEPTIFETFVATKANRPLSRYAQSFVDVLREEMGRAAPALNDGRHVT